jgi:HK97 family phage prohead protease
MSASKKPIERRMFNADIEVRSNADGTVGLRGYAAVFDSEAHGEVVRASAFNTTLKQRDNVRLLVNHDGIPMASTKAGTMTLSVDQRGLLVDAPSLDLANPTVQELVSAMNRGDIDQMSFAFADLSPVKKNASVREITDCVLYDVSVVTYPWYEATSVGLTGDRDMDRALVLLRSLNPDQLREVTVIALEGDVTVSNVTDNSVEDEADDAEELCPSCGAECPDGANYCPSCGTPIAPATDPVAVASEPARMYSVAEARALLGL